MYFQQKLDLLKQLYATHKCDSFVETGTYEARMTLAMAVVCPIVRTIELSDKLHKEAQERVEAHVFKEGYVPDVKLLLGNSGTMLTVCVSLMWELSSPVHRSVKLVCWKSGAEVWPEEPDAMVFQ